MLLDAATSSSVLQSTLIVALLSFSAAALALITLGRLARHHQREYLAPNSGLLTDGCVFIFSGRKLWLASDAAQEFLDRAKDDDIEAWDCLVKQFRQGCPSIARMLDDLVLSGKGFHTDIETAPGQFTQVEGIPRGSVAAIYLRDLSQDRMACRKLAEDLAHRTAEARLLQTVADLAPVYAWCRSRTGRVIWANARLKTLIGTADEATDETAEGATDTAPDGPALDFETALPAELIAPQDREIAFPIRVDLARHGAHGADAAHWVDLYETATDNGDIMGFAVDATAIAKAESTLHRFMGTLTDTFAHLPIGLATFDADRHLSLFNPALSDLLHLDNGWLAQKPTLREFLDRLREKQVMPEQKDFESWRAETRMIEDGALDGTLSQKWIMPTGKTFQITGRPHPQGALALLFEDITSRAVMEQNYRGEMEVSQATLDRLAESVAVFDTAGSLVMSNAAFAGLWGFDPMAALGSMSVGDAIARWSAACMASPVWDQLREFATGAGDRIEWTADMTLLDGRRIAGRFAPMPNGSTLMVFDDVSAVDRARASQQDRLSDLVRAHAQERALLRLAIDDLSTTLDEIGQGLGTIAPKRGKDAAAMIAKTRDRCASVVDQAAIAGAGASLFGDHIPVMDRLADLVARAHLKIDASRHTVTVLDSLDGTQQRSVISLLQVATDLATPGSGVDLSLVRLDDAVAMSCLIQVEHPDRIDTAADTSMPFRLLNRYAEAISGSAALEPLDEGKSGKISCTIPSVPDQDVSRITGQGAG